MEGEVLGMTKGNHVHLELVGLSGGPGEARFVRSELTRRWAATSPRSCWT